MLKFIEKQKFDKMQAANKSSSVIKQTRQYIYINCGAIRLRFEVFYFKQILRFSFLQFNSLYRIQNIVNE